MGILESSRIPLHLPDDGGPDREIPPWKILGFHMQHQLRTLWCWAATAVSMALFYRKDTKWTQCTMVCQQTGLRDCCIDLASKDCNQPRELGPALRRAGVFDSSNVVPPTYDVLMAQIEAGRPVAFRISWEGGGSHFAVIDGFERVGLKRLSVCDPCTHCDGAKVPFSTLLYGRYHGAGTWTDTFLTKR
jgi:hypothetical protein